MDYRVLREFARACSKAEINLSFDQTYPTATGSRTKFHRNRVDGVIVTSVSDVDGVCRSLEENALPYILLRRRHPDDAAPYIDTADDEGMHRIVRYLYDLGHRRIGYLGTESQPSRLRLRGYLQAHQDLGLPVNNDWIIQRRNPIEFVRNLFYHDPRPTAIACYDDRRAVHLLRWCQVHGVQVPEDLSITGFGDEEITDLISPAITTVHIPVRAMVEHAVETLLEAIREQKRPEVNQTLPVYLVERQTTAPPQVILQK